MSATAVTLEEFLARVTATLAEIESNLHRLGQEALLQVEQVRSEAGNGSVPADDQLALRLQQVGRQLVALSERSRSLQAYLQQGLDVPPIDDSHWPRIRILQSQEEDRAQLARELENGVGQLLANAVFELASYRHLLSGDAAPGPESLGTLQAELEQGLAGLRHFIVDLEPTAILGTFGLAAGLRRYLEQFELRTGLKTALQINANIGRLPSIIEVAIFRIIREALNNVDDHARATRVEVKLEEKDGMLEFCVTDNGEGLSLDRVDPSHRSLGLARMVDYAELLNGRLRIFSEPGQGTRVVLSVPYPEL